MSAVTRSDPFAAAWVTPQQQLEQIFNEEIEKTELAKKISSHASQLLPPIRNIIVHYVGPDCLDLKYTLWHKALTNRNALPTEIPPLPAKTFQALEEENFPFPRVVLLVPDEFNDEGFKKVTPLRYISVYREKHPNDRFLNQTNQWVWVVLTHLLPKSDSSFKTCKAKKAMITNLNKNPGIVYEIPSFKIAIVAAFLYSAITGQSLYEDCSILVKDNQTNDVGVLFNCFNSAKAVLFDGYSKALVLFNKCSHFFCQGRHGIGAMRKL